MLLISGCAIVSIYCLYKIQSNNKDCIHDNPQSCHEIAKLNEYYTNLMISNIVIAIILVILNNKQAYISITNRSGNMYAYLVYAALAIIVLYNVMKLSGARSTMTIISLLFIILCVYFIYTKIEYRRSAGYDKMPSMSTPRMSLPRNVYSESIYRGDSMYV